MSDPYENLEVPRDASDDEIKRAYRRLAREFHPDANQGDPASEMRFKEISLAYETLRDPERRRRYDMFGEQSGRGGAAPGDAFGFSDLFEAFFGGNDPFGGGRGPMPTTGPDVEVAIELSLAEAAFGTTPTVDLTIPVECETCDGSGCEPGTHPSRCDTCGGAGQVRQVRRSILGQLVTAVPCGACDATGSRILSPCKICRGEGRVRATRSIEVEVPPGVDDGQRLRVAGRGAAGPRGAQTGDLYVTIRVRGHADLERHGEDLLTVRVVGLTQAVLGARFEIETLDGPAEIDVPAGTQPGTMIRVKGRGVPRLQARGRGDLIVRIDVEIPTKLGDEETQLVRRLAELCGDEVTEGRRTRLRFGR